MATLFVILGTFTALHHEGGISLGKVGEDFEVESCSEVVRIGDEHVLVSTLEEGSEGTRADESGVEISVARWAPFVAWIRGTSSRLLL
jgi:hypothetical protein